MVVSNNPFGPYTNCETGVLTLVAVTMSATELYPVYCPGSALRSLGSGCHKANISKYTSTPVITGAPTAFGSIEAGATGTNVATSAPVVFSLALNGSPGEDTPNTQVAGSV